MFNSATITKVLPEKHGVLVVFRNGVEVFDVGSGTAEVFVRVLARRAHASGGASIDLPEVGEVGLVAEVEPGLRVWMGSLYLEDQHQVDPRPGIAAWRHTSGAQLLVTKDGDAQFFHPSGFTITLSRDGSPLDELAGTVDPDLRSFCDGDLQPHLRIWHHNGFHLHLDPAGNLLGEVPGTLTAKVVGAVSLDAGATLDAKVAGDVALDAGAKLSAVVAGDAFLDLKAKLLAKVGGAATVDVAGALDAKAGGDATLQAPKIVLQADSEIDLTAPLVKVSSILQVGGVLQANGGISTTSGAPVPGGLKMAGGADLGGSLTATDATLGGKQFSTHKHSGVTAGGAMTAPPV